MGYQEKGSGRPSKLQQGQHAGCLSKMSPTDKLQWLWRLCTSIRREFLQGKLLNMLRCNQEFTNQLESCYSFIQAQRAISKPCRKPQNVSIFV